MPRAPKATGPTTKQLGLLHVGKRELGLTDTDYRAILYNVAGVESAGDLDPINFDAVLAHMRSLGFAPASSRKSFGHRIGMASPAQVELIGKLWREYYDGPEEDADRALNTWLTRFHHLSALRFVTSQMAQKVIPGLRAMAERRQNGH